MELGDEYVQYAFNDKRHVLCMYSSGPNMWRDSQTPKQILTAFCKKQSLLGPIFASTTTVRVGNRLYNLNDFGMYVMSPITSAVACAFSDFVSKVLQMIFL